MDSEEPIDNEGSSAEDSSINLAEQVNKVAETYLENLRKGQPDNQQELIDQYPELCPELETRIKVFEAVFRATLGSSRKIPDEMTAAGLSSGELLSNEIANTPSDQSSDDSFEVRQRDLTNIHQDLSLRIRCPHCGNPVQLVSRENHEVSCGSCGSSVQIQVPDTQAENVFAIPKLIGRFSIKRLLG